MKAYREIRIREVKGRRTLLPAGLVTSNYKANLHEDVCVQTMSPELAE